MAAGTGEDTAVRHQDPQTDSATKGKRTIEMRRPRDFGTFPERNDGIIRDPVLYNGKPVSYVKQLSAGDPGWEADRKMVLLQEEDGTTIVAEHAEISDLYVPMQAAVERPRRVPEATDLPKTRTPKEQNR